MTSRDRDILTTWQRQSGRDRRNTRWALIAALVVHVLIFVLPLP